MSHPFSLLLLLPIAAILAGAAGCQRNAEATRERFIQDMITGLEKQKSEILEQSRGIYTDVRAFRGQDSDVVVFERELAEGYDEVNPQLKSLLVEEMKGSEASRKALKLGIEIRMIDKTHGGKVVSDFTISESDL